MANLKLFLLCWTLVSSFLGATTDRTLKRKVSTAVGQSTNREKRQCSVRPRTETSSDVVSYGRRTTRSSNRTERKNYAEIDQEDDMVVDEKVPEERRIPEPPKAETAIKEKRALTVFDLSADQLRVLEAWIFYHNHRNYCDPIHVDYQGVLLQKKDEHDPFERRFPERFVCANRHPEPRDIHLLPDDPWRSASWRQYDLLRSMNNKTVEVDTSWLTSDLMEEWINYTPDYEIRPNYD